ncbi:MAG TPA: Uma2 family endonuclease [Thermomicrobiales bacterium]|nr:Uma2 family endonuclease [Thermomicrobiales bacterium]
MVTPVETREDLMLEELMSTERGPFLEVHRGLSREKPTDLSEGHTIAAERVTYQLDPARFAVRSNSGRVRRGNETWYVPDVYVVPRAAPSSLRKASHRFEIFDEALALIVEIWSPSTDCYDVAEKLPEYMLRGDHEIWSVHPVELTLTVWRRRDDGTFAESVHRGGRLELAAVPGVVVDLDALFA